VGHTDLSRFSVELVLGILAMLFGTLNVVGGFAVTDRMLEMFKKKKK
jgi:NAD(P) transhydrogenase subunit alpha